MSELENNCSVLTVATKCEVCGCFDVSQSNVWFTLLLQPPFHFLINCDMNRGPGLKNTEAKSLHK